jgi:hypothetical protein
MKKETKKLITLGLVVALTFVVGVWFELDYRILTRRTVIFLANYRLGFYGGKDFRILETDIAFILTLIPITFYLTSRNVHFIKRKMQLYLVYGISIPMFYCTYCFLESQFINLTVTQPIIDDGVLKYHHNNVNYRMILLLTILSTFAMGTLIRYISGKAEGNKV